MKADITYGHLLSIEQDLNAITKQNPGLSLLLHSSINNFYAKNKTSLKILNEKHGELLKAHTVPDEKGEPSFITKEDKSIEYVWATPSSKATFDKESKEFLETRMVTVYL